MAWLISYRYRAMFKHGDGIRSNEPTDDIYLTDVHPAKFVADSRRKAIELEEAAYEPSKGVQRVDAIELIYSAVYVTDGMLSIEDADLLR